MSEAVQFLGMKGNFYIKNKKRNVKITRVKTTLNVKPKVIQRSPLLYSKWRLIWGTGTRLPLNAPALPHPARSLTACYLFSQ